MALIEVPAADGKAEAWLARPAGAAGAPGVLLYCDAFGLRPRIEDMADRIAGWGYVVLAPNVFYRHGDVATLRPTTDLRDPAERARVFEAGRERLEALTSARVDADAPHWLDALARAGGEEPFGVVGYCMGARLAVRTAAAQPERVAAVAGFHAGRLVTDAPDSPHTVLPLAHAEFFFGHADNDPAMPREQIAALEAALSAAGLKATSVVYPGAPHGYSMADLSSYDPQGEARHWEDLRALLDRVLDPASSEPGR